MPIPLDRSTSIGISSVFDDLLAAAQAGAEWAWRRLYDEYSSQLLAFAWSRGVGEPEDLVGEVFVQLVRDIGDFVGGEPAFRGWIFTITRNRIIDDYRLRSRRPFDATEPAHLLSLGDTGDAEADALDTMSMGEVQALLNHLTSDQRDVLMLRIVADFSIDQVARVMGKSPGAVKALQRRALDRLASILENTVTIRGPGTL